MTMRALGVLRVGLHLARAVYKLTFQAAHWNEAQRRDEIARWARGVFALFGMRLVVRGAPPASQGLLFAGNHVSWLDIYALLATTDQRFVAKAEVRRWPVIGWLAARVGTQFIARDRRADVHATSQAVTGLLQGGAHVCIFPEGTTTTGHALRPFRASLFEPAAQGRAHVQPFAIRYLGPDGRASDIAAFTGDMSLGESIWMLLGKGGLTCELTFLDVIDTSGLSRRAIALAAEQAVTAHLGVGVSLTDPTPVPSSPDDAVAVLA
jgi:1-acyl-sn-glycerol-3-phosphate acyltransferase